MGIYPMGKQATITTERTPWPEAMKSVMKILYNNVSQPMTIQEIVRKTQLNRRTVEKTASVLEDMSKYLGQADIVFFNKGNMHLIEAKPRGNQLGLLGLPRDVQNLIIRTKYFPQPSKEEEILVHLFIREAKDAKSALRLDETETIKKLLELENISRSHESTFFLTEVGKMVAIGALEIYPELKKL